METIRGIVHAGKIEFLEPVEVPEGTEVFPSVAENEFWLRASERSLDAIWNNPQDDVYEQLLKK